MPTGGIPGANSPIDEELWRLLAFASAEVGAPVRFVPRQRIQVGTSAVLPGNTVPVEGSRAMHGILEAGGATRLAPTDHHCLAVLARFLADRLDREFDQAQDLRDRTDRVLHVLDAGRLTTVYQPILNLATNEVVGVEALSRFAGEDRPTEQWFADASTVGLGLELETRAITEAIGALEVLPEGLYLSVNVSPSVASMQELRTHLRGVPVERLVMEITEHYEVQDYEALNRTLAPLRRRGMKLAVDDAGAGFASLRHILRIRPDIIKLDMSLVRHIDRDAALRALSYSIASFGAAVDAKVVAEGIESEGELRALRFLGVDYGQGYLLQPPMPLAEMALASTPVTRTMTG
jgi:EAL domain-containing protein (putative c-di-GMP-specific phosphodiesterase class I)